MLDSFIDRRFTFSPHITCAQSKESEMEELITGLTIFAAVGTVTAVYFTIKGKTKHTSISWNVVALLLWAIVIMT